MSADAILFIGRAVLLLAWVGALACGGSADTQTSTPLAGIPSTPSAPAAVGSLAVSGEALSANMSETLILL